MDFSKKYSKEIENFIEVLFELQKNNHIRIITGGYSGIMKLVSDIARKKSKSNKIHLEIVGYLYNGYGENPNESNDKVIICKDLGERIQLMISSGNLFVAMPGKSGTLHEISHLQQEIKHSDLAKEKILLLHQYWEHEFKYSNNFTILNCSNKTDINLILKNINFKTTEFKYESNGISFSSDNIENEIEKLTVEIEKIISGDYIDKFRNVIALDLAYNFIHPESKNIYGINYSHSCIKYKNILNNFLEKYNSLLSIDQEIVKYKELNNSINNFGYQLEDVVKNDLIFESKKEPAKFDDWCKYLEEGGIGKLSIWLNRKIFVEMKPINLSGFLILDMVIPDRIIKRILILMEKFLIHFLSRIMDDYLRKWINFEAPCEKYRIKEFNGKRPDKKLRDIENRFLVPKNNDEIKTIIHEVRNTVLKEFEVKDYNTIKNSLVDKKNKLTNKSTQKIVFPYLINIKDICNYRHFLYGRMLFLTYHIIFKFTLKESYELLLNRTTNLFDRATFQRCFHIKGIKKDKTFRENSKESVIRHEDIIPYLSEAEYQCLLSLCDDITPLDRLKETIINSREPIEIIN